MVSRHDGVAYHVDDDRRIFFFLGTGFNGVIWMDTGSHLVSGRE